MVEQETTFKSGELTLEGLFANPGGGVRAAIVCHPHPMYGGSMYNNVVEAVLSAMWRLGYATLRFNFRGVGESEGEYDGGVGEVDDARAALKFLAAQAGVRPQDAVWQATRSARRSRCVPEAPKVASLEWSPLHCRLR